MEIKIKNFRDNRNKEILDVLINLPPEWEKRVIKYSIIFEEIEDHNGWFTPNYLRQEGLVGPDQTRIFKKRELSKLLENKIIYNKLGDGVEIFRLKQDAKTYNFLRNIYSDELWKLTLSTHSKFITPLHVKFLLNTITIPLVVYYGKQAATQTTNADKAIKIAERELPKYTDMPIIPPSYWDSYFQNPEEFNSRFDELTFRKDNWLEILNLLLGYWKKDFTSAPNIKEGTNPYDVCKQQIGLVEKSIEVLDKNEELFNTVLAYAQTPAMSKFFK